MSTCLVHLLLTGIASPSLDKQPDVGLLTWHHQDQQVRSLRLGKLRNPNLPVWLTCVDDQWGILFSSCIEIGMKFSLHYYSQNTSWEDKETLLMVDTIRTFDNDETSQEKSPLTQAIQSRWEGAKVDWQGKTPFV